MDSLPAKKRSFLLNLFISSEETRLRSGWRLVGQFALMTLLAIPFACPLAVWMMLKPPSNTLLFMANGALGFISITASVFLARRLFDRRSITSLGLALSRRVLLDLLAGFLIAGVMMGFIFLVEWGAGWLVVERFAWQDQPAWKVILDVFTWLLIFVAVGWQEELLARGYWLQNLAEGLNPIWAVFLSSIFFSLGHLLNPNVSWNAILGLVLAGIFLAFGYLRTRQLWLPIGLHIGWNFFEGTIFGFQVSGLTEMPQLIRQVVQGPELVTGGLFGPEAGLVVLPALALGVLIILGYSRTRLAND
jgi:membrane protease YdiL (CAAX protease family)